MKIKIISTLTAVLTLLLTSIVFAAIPGDVSEGKYIKAYVRGTQNVAAYRDSSLRTRGNSRGAYNAAVYPTDEIRIYQMNSSVAYIGYIAGKNWVKAYIPTSAITPNNSSRDGQRFSSGVGRGSVFSRPNGTVYSGSAIDAGDTVWKLAEENGYTQVVYPAGSVYKMAWIRTGDYNSCVSSSPVQAGNVPDGSFDSVVSNNANQITVAGWAADRDNMNESLRIHVYVGGAWNSGVEGYEIVANKSRPDVHRYFDHLGIPSGEYYGFNETINVKRTGNQPVYVYAINIGGGAGNIELGHKNIEIKSATVVANNAVRTLPNGWYQISPTHDLRRVLDVNGNSASPGANIMMNTSHGGNNQKFYLQNRGDGWFSLKDGHCDNYITADGSNVGANLSSRPWNGSNNQLFKLVDGGGGSYHVIAKVNQNINFDCAGGGKSDGTNVQLWSKENCSAHHKWKFTSTSAPSTTPTPVAKKQALRTVDAYEYSSLQNRIGRVDEGDMVTILEESANAYRVEYPTPKGAKYGWVTKDIFKENSIIKEDWDSKIGQKLANINSINYQKPTNPFPKSYVSSKDKKYHDTNCTWYAFGRMREITGKSITPRGNAGSWHNATSWDSNLTSKCVAERSGHVVFVEYVDDGRGYVYFTECNWNVKDDYKVQRKTIADFRKNFKWFIH